MGPGGVAEIQSQTRDGRGQERITMVCARVCGCSCMCTMVCALVLPEYHARCFGTAWSASTLSRHACDTMRLTGLS